MEVWEEGVSVNLTLQLYTTARPKGPRCSLTLEFIAAVSLLPPVSAARGETVESSAKMAAGTHRAIRRARCMLDFDPLDV